MTTGAALVAEIDGYVGEPGKAGLWWLGQHSFVGKLGESVVYFDPYLSPSPKRHVPPLLEPADMGHAQVILGSHDHTDHIDRKMWPAMAEGAPDAVFVIPEAVREEVLAETSVPAERVLGINAGETVCVGGVEIFAIPAAHELVERDEQGQCRFLGFFVRGHGVTIYHAGDTCVYEGLYDWVRPQRPDAMLLPINGRDFERLKRNCIGNMTYQEAVDFAGALKPGVAVPTHFEMFPGNTVDVGEFRAYANLKYPELNVQIPVHGALMEVTAAAGTEATADVFMQAAIEEAEKGLAEGGIPIGSVIVHDGKIIGRGHNRRVQQGSPTLHGEMDAFENAGRQPASVYRECTLYTTLSPCAMCTGAILLYEIPRVIVGENQTFLGEEGHLMARGVEVEVLQDARCMALMREFIEAKPELWNEDIGV